MHGQGWSARLTWQVGVAGPLHLSRRPHALQKVLEDALSLLQLLCARGRLLALLLARLPRRARCRRRARQQAAALALLGMAA